MPSFMILIWALINFVGKFNYLITQVLNRERSGFYWFTMHNFPPTALPMLRSNNPLWSFSEAFSGWKIVKIGFKLGSCTNVATSTSSIFLYFIFERIMMNLKNEVNKIVNILFEWCIRLVNLTKKNTIENINSLHDWRELL